jgi:hypothetical protein
MTNGSVEIATGVLQKAGVDSLVDAVMDVAQCSTWKPAPTAYQFAVWSPGFKLQPGEVRPPADSIWILAEASQPLSCRLQLSRCLDAVPGSGAAAQSTCCVNCPVRLAPLLPPSAGDAGGCAPLGRQWRQVCRAAGGLCGAK